jgi:CheY-like chemotaxis protein
MQNLPTILVVEDDQLIQSVVEETLTDGGFEIDIAASAAQAIEFLDKQIQGPRHRHQLGARPDRRVGD